MITLANVKKQLGEFQLAVREASFHNGLTLVVGENGAGKSTLLQLLSTALFPDQGEIDYHRQTIHQDLPLIRMEIGFLPTGIELYEEMTTNKFLSYLCELKGLQPHSEIPVLLDDFGLRPFENKKIAKLSEGQVQRIAIAQAFLGHPHFVFLDEPLTSLDIAERKRVTSYISQYARKRIVIVASHELNEWDGRCDLISWVHDGQIHFQGNPQEWASSLPLSIWVGETSVEDLASIRYENLIHSHIQNNQAQLRLIARENPNPAVFAKAQPTLVDAYLIRNRMSEAKLE